MQIDWLYGLLGLSFWGYVLAAFILTQITLAAVTLYLHRCMSHRAIDLHPIVSHFFRFWLWLTTGMTTKSWVAIHRKHHTKCETAEDPHSPVVLGINKVLLEGAELYRAEEKNDDTIERYGMGTPDDWLERNVYSRHKNKGIVTMLFIDLLLFGVPGFTIWAVQMLWIPLFAAGVINGIGHYFGYRNFDSPDAARNIVPWAVFICGEELHNNHHAFPSSAKLSARWWEFDLGWFYIKTLSYLRLATIKRIPPKLHLLPEKTRLDMDSLSAICAHRFKVLRNYSKNVMLPVLKEEKARASDKGRALLRRAKKNLFKERKLIDNQNMQNLKQLLEQHEALELVYQYRQRLQEIWDRTSASPKELLEALQQWCRNAEATGVRALQEFADSLKQYSLQTAPATA